MLDNDWHSDTRPVYIMSSARDDSLLSFVAYRDNNRD